MGSGERGSRVNVAEWRRVDKKLYSDKKIMRLSRDARLLFIGMITIAGDDGYGDADPCVLKAQLFPGDDLKISEIEGWRTELHTLGLIRLWSKGADLFYNLPNWDKYQVVNFDRRGCKKHLLDTNGLTEVAQDTERVPSEHREHIQTDSTDSTVQTEEGASAKKLPPPAIQKLSTFHEVYATLRGINARVYRDLPENTTLNEVLATETARLGSDRILAEAKRFALWLEDQLRSGAEKREKRHRPYKRFADWLARSKPGDTGNANNYRVDEFGRRETPTGRLLRLAREEQAGQYERSGTA